MAPLPRPQDDPQRERHVPFSRRSPRKTPQDEKNEKSRLCVICATKKPGIDFLPREESLCYCNHRRSRATCRQCMGRYLAMQIEERPDARLACMHCNREWSFEQARKLLPRDVADLYDSTQAYKCMEAMPDFLLCPYPDCTAGAIYDTSCPDFPYVRCPDFPYVRCHACSRPSCQVCHIPWQQDHSCAKFSSSTEASRRTVRSLIEAGARRCPKCHYVVVKDGGCNTIHCTACGASFCWRREAKLVDDIGSTRSKQLRSALRALLTRLRRRVQRVLSKPLRVALHM